MIRVKEALSTALAITAIVGMLSVSVFVLRLAFAGSNARSRPGIGGPPMRVANWPALIENGHRFGPDNAQSTIVVFSDFQCPYCRRFALNVMPNIRAAFPNVAFVFHHWPLRNHQYAYSAARASECAAAQGRFQQFHDLLFAEQDSLGIKPFDRFAREARVADLLAFRQCASATNPVRAVDLDSAAARAAGGQGTPTVIVNGWRFSGAVDSATIDSALRAATTR